MIQVIGSSNLRFNRNKVSFNFLNSQLENEFVKHDIISQDIRNDEYKVKIKFIMNMNRINHCKSLNDYQSYVFDHFVNKLPNNVNTTSVIAYKIAPVSNSIKHLNEHKKVKKYIDDLINK